MTLISNYTALYSALDQEYSQVMSGPYEIIVANKETVCALKDGKITGLWRPMVCSASDLNDNYQYELIATLWTLSNDIFYEDFLIDGKLSPISKFLLEKGYIAEPYYTQVIDLTKTEEELHADIRKSYKSLCNDGCAEIADASILSVIHRRMHNGETRPARTWDIQNKMGFTIVNGNLTAGVMFYQGPIWSYYACSASVDNANTHQLIWAGIKMLKNNGCKYLEMGEIKYSGDEKLVNISKFKRGFGGQTQVRLRLRKA